MARYFTLADTEYLYVSATPVTTTPMTMACWAYIASDSNYTRRHLIAIGDSAARDSQSLDLYRAANTSQRYVEARSIDAATASQAQTTTVYSLSTWRHCCAVFAAADDRRSYIDGAGKGTEATARDPADLDTIAIGSRYDSLGFGEFHDGAIAHAAIWDAVLTDDEVAALAAGADPRTIRPANLAFYAPMVRDEDLDIVGGLALTAVNTPTIADHPPKVRGPAPVHRGSAVPAPPVITEVDVTLGRTHATTELTAAAALAAVSAGRELGASDSGAATALGAITAGRSHAATDAGAATALSSTMLGRSHATTELGTASALASVSAGRELGATEGGATTALGAATLGRTQAASATGGATALASTTLGRAHTVSVSPWRAALGAVTVAIRRALALVGIEMPSPPSWRTFTPPAETRSYTPTAEIRTFTPERDKE